MNNSNGNRYAEVYLDIKTLEIDHPFDYQIPLSLANDVKIGSIVLVPFKSRLEIGYVVKVKNKSTLIEEGIKSIERVINNYPIFDRNRLKLIYWMSFYYIQPLGRVFRLFLPPGKNYRVEKVWKLEKEKLKKFIDNYPDFKYITQIPSLLSLEKVKESEIIRDNGRVDYKRILKYLEKKNLATYEYTLSYPKIKLKYQNFICLNGAKFKKVQDKINWNRNFSQKKIIDYLIYKDGGVSRQELFKHTGVSHSSLKALVDKDIVNVTKKRVRRDFRYDYLDRKDEHRKRGIFLNPYQKKCLESISIAINKGIFHGFLIEGVAGSGKTEIYIKCCEKVLEKNKKALVLTPEISLTPQLFSRFKSVFGSEVCVYHSGMSEAERYERWLDIWEDRYSIIIGTRSSLFTPINDLGIIIIDEEHDPSYKEASLVRYNTQDVALKLGKILSIPVVFGSATPSLVTKYKVENDKNFTLLRIPIKACGQNIVNKQVVDLTSIDRFKEDSIITNKLFKEINKEIKNNNKIIIFINRRGYSNFVICRNCGNIPKCSKCNLSYNFHRDVTKLVCHHCGKEEKFIGICPNCGGSNISMYGTGIQKVESKLKMRFKNIPILRMDSDVTSKKKSHEAILKRFISPGPSILIGTQMVTKGLDIDDVTLVGIINCDSMLALPDFHMHERVYQLITQVSGRAGRRTKKGTVIIQTYNPKSAFIKNFIDGDYNKFYKLELEDRKELLYPPFSNLINIVISGKNEIQVRNEAKHLFEEVRKFTNGKNMILGPAPAPFYKISLFYRWHILIKTMDIKRLNVKLSRMLKKFEKYKKNKIIIDVDPVWIL